MIRTIRARWVFPGIRLPIPDGQISFEADTIVRVGGSDPAFPVDLDLGEVAIVPGFNNAHTHLELASIARDEAAGPEDEVAWLGRVIRSRQDPTAEPGPARIERHLRDAIAAGTTGIGDITTLGQSWAAMTKAPVRGVVFTEVLGLSDARSRQTWEAAQTWIDGLTKAERTSGLVRPGISPHAPYSTAGWLYESAAATGLPLATHLGELPAEREFLSQGTGPLRRFVEDLGAWTDAWKPVGPAPIDYLAAHRQPRSSWIIAHGNIFEPPEFAPLLPAPGDPASARVAVAYCPRTHARFGHPPHPFRAMLAAGVVVCLGTDSLASSPTLSLLDEVRFLYHHHPDVPGATILAMATLNGARALGIDHTTGSLEPGKSADFAVLGLGPTRHDDPHRDWLEDGSPPLATMFRGRFVAGQWD